MMSKQMTNYNERLDEVIAQASASIGGFGKLEIEAKQAITSLIKELMAEAKQESHKSGYIQALADFSGYYMDASIPAQRKLIMPHIAIELTENYKYPQLPIKSIGGSRMIEEYCLTVMNPTNWNEFEHRQVVFTRIKKAGNGKDKPISQVLQIWDVATDTLVVELTQQEEV